MPPKKSNRGRGGSSKKFDVSSLYHQFTKFNDLILPSNGDIIRYSRFVKSQHPLTLQKKNQNVATSVIAKDVTSALFDIWSAKVHPFISPTVILSYDSTYKKVLRLLEEAKELNKGGSGKSNQVLLEKLSRMSDCLFDLFKCR